MHFLHKYLSLVFLSVNLIFSLFAVTSVFAEESLTSTKIVVAEGTVVCFEIPKELVEAVGKIKETAIGTFVKMQSEETCTVNIDNEETLSYLSKETGLKLRSKLVPSVKVYLVKKTREDYKTNWDIISVGTSVEPLQAYSNGVVSEAKPSDILSMVADLAKPQTVATAQTAPNTGTAIVTNPVSVPTTDEIKEEEKTQDDTFPEPTPAPQPEPTPTPTPTPTPEPESPTITTSSSLSSGTEGTAYTQTLSATGGTGIYTWSLTSGTLPSGLSVSSGGIISGTPATGSAGSYSFTIKVTDTNSKTDSKAFTLVISAATVELTITTSSLSNGTEGIAYSQTLSASGGTTPYTWSITTGTLPTGLSISTGGIISGTCSAGSSGTYTFTASVADSGSQTASKELTITVTATDLTITTSSLPNGTETVAYSQTVSATGGTTPYTWSISVGSLPTGLTLSTEGVISGTPTTRNTYTFTVKVTDNNSVTATKELSIKIGYYQTAVDDYVWVANWTDNNVTRITKSDSSTTNVSVGNLPFGVAVDDTYVWVANRSSNSVTRITKSDSSTTTIAVGTTPLGVAVDDIYVWVANSGDNNVTRVKKSDSSTTTIAVGTSPLGVAVDDTYVWVVNSIAAATVTRIKKSDLTTTDIGVWAFPIGVAVDSTYVWVANSGSDNVTRITKSDSSSTNIAVGSTPTGIAVDDTYVWVVNNNDDTVTRITKSDLTTTNISVGVVPYGVAVDNTYVWVANRLSDNVTRITKSNSSTTNISVGDSPYNLGDATGYSFDQFFTGTYVDPAITGRIYDSETGETVQGTVTSIYQKGSTTALQTSTTNPYSFNVLDGEYYIRVEREGYTFPSNTKDGITPGDHGEVFTASGTRMGIDIPIDQGYPLEITKTSNKKTVVTGDIITYDVKIRNNSMRDLLNVNIQDQITNGFKYVNKSTYIDNTRLPETNVNITGHNGTFKLINVPGHKTTHLTYQVRVSSGISTGEYKTKAVAWDRQRNWQMSNETACTVIVEADALFTLGTIIGKVYWDKNGNGIQDKPLTHPSPTHAPRGCPGGEDKGEGEESGIAGVTLATEYGVVVQTDKDGKYHIPAVPPGTHLLKVDIESVKVSGCQSVNFTTENPYMVKITEGLLAKVNFGVTQIVADEVTTRIDADTKKSETLAPKASAKGNISQHIKQFLDQFFIVALGEGVVRNVSTSGNIKMVEQNDTFDEGVNVDGKLALYLKGKIKGKYLITASLDTDRSPSKRGIEYQLRKLFTNLDPDKYYPVYGDASKIDYSANDTQDELYLLVQWDKSHVKWGAFETDIPLYNRTLQGAHAVYESVKETKYGDPYTKVNAFFAKANQLAAHDEFIGTGGSLYYLRHTPTIEGSEKVRVELRDQVTKQVLGSGNLIEQTDYEIDYDTGRIILKKPLSSVNYNYSASIISNDILSGARAYLVIDYEYQSTSPMRKEAFGGKVSQQIGDHFRVGGTYIDEDKETNHYKLMGGDGTIKINEVTDITAEYDRSEETQLAGSYSIDGGLTDSTLPDNINDGKTGNAFNIAGRTKLFNNTDINLGYTRQSKNFSATNTISTQGSDIYTASILSSLKENLLAGIKFAAQEVKKATLAANLVGDNRVYTTTALMDYTPNKWDMRLEYQHQTVDHPFIDYTYEGYRQLLAYDVIGSRVGYRFTDRVHPYIGGQASVQGFVNNQGYVGLEYRIWDKTNLNLKETVGNLGNSTLVGLTSQLTPETEAYTNIEIGNNAQPFQQESPNTGQEKAGQARQSGEFVKTTYGQKTQIDKNCFLSWQKDYSSWQSNILQGDLVGYDKKLSDTLALGLSYERAQIEKLPTAISRDSGSVALTYLDVDVLSLFTKIELREDRGQNTERQWLTQNSLLYQLNKDISLIGRGNWSRTDNRTQHDTTAQFHELGVGLAYRPVDFDKLNLLAKYSYITNDMPDSQNDFVQATDDIRNIYAIEGAYDIFRYLQLVGKFAMRDMSEKVGPRDWTASETYLYIGRVNFHVTNKWDISGEYRTLANKQIEDSKAGWLVEVDREIIKFVRLGAGYNFTDYDDDLSNNDNYDAKGWFIRVNGKY